MDADWLKNAETTLASVGLTLKGILVGAVSAFIAMRIWSGLDRTVDRWGTFFGGWAMAAWIGEPLRVWLELSTGVGTLIIFIVGLFGMALTTEIIKALRNTNWSEMLKLIVELFFKRGSSSSLPPPSPPRNRDSSVNVQEGESK